MNAALGRSVSPAYPAANRSYFQFIPGDGNCALQPEASSRGCSIECRVHSSSHMIDDDLNAIAVYPLSLKPAEQQWPRALAANDVRVTAGRAIYKDNCAACRTDAGTGAASLFPRLAGSPAVRSDNPTTLIRTVLFGSQAAAGADRARNAEFRLAAQRRTGGRGGHLYSQRLGQCGRCRVARSGADDPRQMRRVLREEVKNERESETGTC